MISLNPYPSLGFPSCVFQLSPIHTISDQFPTQTKLRDDERVDGGDIGRGSGGRDRGDRGWWRYSFSWTFFTIFLGWWRRGRCKMEIIRFRKIFLISSTCRHFRSGDQWEADILEEGARPLSWEGWDRGDYKVGKQGNGIALWLWRLSKSLIYQKQNLMYSA